MIANCQKCGAKDYGDADISWECGSYVDPDDGAFHQSTQCLACELTAKLEAAQAENAELQRMLQVAKTDNALGERLFRACHKGNTELRAKLDAALFGGDNTKNIT